MTHRNNDFPTLEQLDRDGALRETAAGVRPTATARRSSASRRAVGGGLALGALPAGLAHAAAAPRRATSRSSTTR